MTSMKLEGWKQIAPYLRVCQKTAQKWELRQRMPVHHLPGFRGQVYAQSEELDAWKLTDLAPAFSRTVTVRLPEDVLTTLRPLIEQRFTSMQEFVSHAVAQYARQHPA
jgi:hypothetical protein